MNAHIIAIFAGGLVKDTGGWRTTWLDEGDDFGVLGDRFRVLAGVYTYKQFRKENRPAALLVIGGRGHMRATPDMPAISQVMAGELETLGIAAPDITIESNSGTTFEGLLVLQKFLEAGQESVTLISNEYHLPRIQAMIECLDALSALNNVLSAGILSLCSAEQICIANDSEQWETMIADAYQSTELKKRVSLEQQGVRDILKGGYVL
ncbi:MAG: hypothetical protein COW88_01830 [Candidatus Lloydbacteria bacterium CG22_combo_CG10-13_8_21_14_all_47_15]|uniref:DUF218 domain-containing protein n=1 Tax=Candidatus Lloydbacteria bacterium CG22_combo_CG10-13_8_21_14_all_47_15 TaxID=1974635 RepID=A0A2H0CUA6_9BACT|nr:MAG: hypothetical protein COW88_01830 [Candidatus Lloydbacteria bacterium CG22_combo_CG10-13_8_21_14_all_47_15]